MLEIKRYKRLKRLDLVKQDQCHMLPQWADVMYRIAGLSAKVVELLRIRLSDSGMTKARRAYLPIACMSRLSSPTSLQRLCFSMRSYFGLAKHEFIITLIVVVKVKFRHSILTFIYTQPPILSSKRHHTTILHTTILHSTMFQATILACQNLRRRSCIT